MIMTAKIRTLRIKKRKGIIDTYRYCIKYIKSCIISPIIYNKITICPLKPTNKRIQPIRKHAIDHKFGPTDTDMYISYYIHIVKRIIPNLEINNGDDMYYENKEIKLTNISILNRLYQITNRYIALMVGQDGHVSIILIDNDNETIEYFDTVNDSFKEHALNDVIDFYFPSYRFKVVNNGTDIQESNYDVYCQTWIFYYIYQRLYNNKTSDEIMEKLKLTNSEERVDIIRDFFFEFTSFTS